MFAMTNSFGNNLTSIGFSLERDNFEYLKVLPIDMKKYAREKFKVLFLTQSSVPILLLSIVLLVLRMPVLLVLTIIVTWFSISFGLSAWGFERDYRLRVPNWSNIVELQSRGNKFLLGFLMFILFILLILCIVASFPIIHFLPETIGYIIGAAAFIILNGLGLFFGEFYLRKLKKAL